MDRTLAAGSATTTASLLSVGSAAHTPAAAQSLAVTANQQVAQGLDATDASQPQPSSVAPYSSVPNIPLPRDLHDIAKLMQSMNIPFHESVLPLLLDYYHTIAREALVTLHELNAYTGKTVADTDDAELALQLVAQKHAQPLTPELLFPIAAQRNSVPMPLLRVMKDAGDIALPPERFRLTAVEWDVSEQPGKETQMPSQSLAHSRNDRAVNGGANGSDDPAGMAVL